MRTARSSSHRGGICLSACWDTHPPGVGLEMPPPLGVGLETPPRPDPSTSPLGVGLETPLARPLKFSPGCGPGNLQGMLGYPPPPRPAAKHAGEMPPPVWAWRPPHRPDPSTSPLGVGLETPGLTPQLLPWVWAWKPAMHAGIPPPPPMNRITDTCKNITLPQLRCWR